MTTPTRASFAGFAETRQSPSLRDIARRIMEPADKVRKSKELQQALQIATPVLIVIFILIILYALNVIIFPHLRILLLSVLFGSFLHPMKRSFAKFFKTLLKDIRKSDRPILAGIGFPLLIVDRVMEWFRNYTCRHAYGLLDFGKSLMVGDFRSVMAVCLAAMSLGIIGAGSLINFVMCINLITFVTDITKTDLSFSDAYLYFLTRSFFMTQICWLNPNIILVLLLFVALWAGISWLIKILKRRLSDGYRQFSNDDSNLSASSVDQVVPLQRHNSRLSVGFQQAYESSLGVYQIILGQVDDSIDTISSACVIGIVAVIVVALTIYLSFQIYIESIYIIEKASLSANAIQESNPELKSWMPDWINVIHFLLDVAVKNIYQHGREWIRKSTKQLLSNSGIEETIVGTNDTTTSVQIEKQLVDFWDRAYELWARNRTDGSSNLDNLSKRNTYEWDRLLVALQSLNFGLFTQILKQNWETLLAVMGSLTKLLKNNLNLAVNLITVTTSLLLLWANVLLNFVVDLLIFITALFYLLCASEEEYKPIELLKSAIPKSRSSSASSSSTSAPKESESNREEFLSLVDESINAVFTVSLKMMVFHGLSTWLLHMLFELKVVYVPSVISAIFAVVPFIAPYWASVPACIDLWLSGYLSQAVLMFLLAIIPSSFVTTAFYSEIKGAGHPYLTGLAIAAGIYVFGIEGALFGPMLLVSIRLLPLVLVFLLDLYK